MASHSSMRPITPNLTFAPQIAPSSPPDTPSTSTFRESRNFSRPLQRHPGGAGPQFNYNPQIRLEDLSPRSASPSSDGSASPPRSRSPSPEPVNVADKDKLKGQRPASPPMRSRITITHGNFTIEEFRDGDYHNDSDGALSVLRPEYEDAESDYAPSVQPATEKPDPVVQKLADNISQLKCSPPPEPDDRETILRLRREANRKKRLSSGSIHKRTLSQSIGSDTDDEDLQPFDYNEAGSSARRLRRKTGERMSLIFDDPPQRIVECEEPVTENEAEMNIPPPDVDLQRLWMHEMPYFDLDGDSMEIDFPPTSQPSPGSHLAADSSSESSSEEDSSSEEEEDSEDSDSDEEDD